MEKEPKRFEEWDDVVDCNECERWWVNQCDGVPLRGSRRPCNSFLATRSVVIPAKIKSLEKGVKRLSWVCIILGVTLVMLLVYNLLEVLL